MKRTVLFATALLFVSVCFSQEVLRPTFSNNVQVDGTALVNEWASDAEVPLAHGNGDTTWFHIKFDSTALYILAAGNLQGKNLFPEVLIDPQYDRSASWQGDWYFHVSATDCESDSAYGDFSDCDTIQPDWQAMPNFVPGGPNVENVEFAIPFSKIQFSSFDDTLGISFVVTNTFNTWMLYPNTADRNDPSTWTSLVFKEEQDTGSSVTERNDQKPQLFPNPATDQVTLTGIQSVAHVKLYGITGQKVMEQSVNPSEPVDLSDLPNGLYLVEVTANGQKRVEKLVIR